MSNELKGNILKRVDEAEVAKKQASKEKYTRRESVFKEVRRNDANLSSLKEELEFAKQKIEDHPGLSAEFAGEIAKLEAQVANLEGGLAGDVSELDALESDPDVQRELQKSVELDELKAQILSRLQLLRKQLGEYHYMYGQYHEYDERCVKSKKAREDKRQNENDIKSTNEELDNINNTFLKLGRGRVTKELERLQAQKEELLEYFRNFDGEKKDYAKKLDDFKELLVDHVLLVREKAKKTADEKHADWPEESKQRDVLLEVIKSLEQFKDFLKVYYHTDTPIAYRSIQEDENFVLAKSDNPAEIKKCFQVVV